jgi:hypothetical protein
LAVLNACLTCFTRFQRSELSPAIDRVVRSAIDQKP